MMYIIDKNTKEVDIILIFACIVLEPHNSSWEALGHAE